jgi:hypothetical protein
MMHITPLTENEKNAIAIKVLDVLIQHQLSNREANEVLSRVTELKNELKLSTNYGQRLAFAEKSQ